MRRDRIIFILLLICVIGLSYVRTVFGPEPGKVTTVAEAKTMYSELGGKEGSVPIVMFVTSWCPYCRKLRGWFEQQQIPYVEVNIEEDSPGSRAFARLGSGPGVPQTLVGPYLIEGFNPQGILAAIQETKRLQTKEQLPGDDAGVRT